MDELDRLAEWPLEEPAKPLPDDPFEGLPEPERATCDKDHLPCR